MYWVAGGEEAEETGSQIEPGKKGGLEGNWFFKIWICFSLSHPDLIGNKLNYFSPN